MLNPVVLYTCIIPVSRCDKLFTLESIRLAPFGRTAIDLLSDGRQTLIDYTLEQRNKESNYDVQADS